VEVPKNLSVSAFLPLGEAAFQPVLTVTTAALRIHIVAIAVEY
jgi:hypothetical protein